MFDFLFSRSSRKQKTLVLQSIISNLPINEYNKSLYLSSIDILPEKEFTLFYNQIVGKMKTKETQWVVPSKPVWLPGINSI